MNDAGEARLAMTFAFSSSNVGPVQVGLDRAALLAIAQVGLAVVVGAQKGAVGELGRVGPFTCNWICDPKIRATPLASSATRPVSTSLA